MPFKLSKLIKIAGTAYALYKANEEEVDSAYRYAKKAVKKISKKKDTI